LLFEGTHKTLLSFCSVSPTRLRSPSKSNASLPGSAFEQQEVFEKDIPRSEENAEALEFGDKGLQQKSLFIGHEVVRWENFHSLIQSEVLNRFGIRVGQESSYFGCNTKPWSKFMSERTYSSYVRQTELGNGE